MYYSSVLKKAFRRDSVNKYPQKGGIKTTALPQRSKWVVTGKRLSVEGRGELTCQAEWEVISGANERYTNGFVAL